MTDVIIIITQAATLLTAVAALWQGLRNGAKIQEVHVTMNSRLDALIKAREQLATAAGHALGVAESAPTSPSVGSKVDEAVKAITTQGRDIAQLQARFDKDGRAN